MIFVPVALNNGGNKMAVARNKSVKNAFLKKENQ